METYLIISYIGEEVKLFYLERIYGLGVFSKDNSVLTATLPQHRKSTLKIEQALRFDPSPQPCTLNDVRKFGSLVKVTKLLKKIYVLNSKKISSRER